MSDLLVWVAVALVAFLLVAVAVTMIDRLSTVDAERVVDITDDELPCAHCGGDRYGYVHVPEAHRICRVVLPGHHPAT